jgi:uncharacterized protein
MSPPFLAGIFASSLLGSLHCASMCGPFVAFYSGGQSSFKPHFVYHAQRAVMYSALGAVGGAVGSGLNQFAPASSGVPIAALVASALTILWGLSALLPRARLARILPSLARALPGLARFLPSLASSKLVQLRARAPVTRAFLLGAFTPLLPCGLLYAFVTLAAGTGSAVYGALTMFVFFLGTLPGLLGLGALVTRLGPWLGARVPRLLGTSLVLIGLWGLYERAPAFWALGQEGNPPACHGH